MKTVAWALLLVLAGCPGPERCDSWKPMAPLDRPLLSAWAPPFGPVYLVGGGLGAPGLGAVALKFDGALTSLPVGHDETLWWVWGTNDGKDVWMVGERGLIARWNGSAFSRIDTGTSATLYGVWGTSSSDVWIVGGTPDAGMTKPNDLVLHWNGSALMADDAPAKQGAAFFKVWGSGANDLWVSGEGGTMWRRTAEGWQDYAAQLATRSSVTTVHGCSAGDVWAVAGQDVFHFDGQAWAKDPAAMALSGANGVSCGLSTVLVVGNGGLKLRLDRVSGVWKNESLAAPYSADFHGALVSPIGALWAVGGNFNAPASAGRYGTIGVFGCPSPTD